ncbi:MAG: cupin domain-containing protein [Deltaproteobacteria bacterium]|nr:cupin domain-containing protein [Deltaproteobacteria bacterium]
MSTSTQRKSTESGSAPRHEARQRTLRPTTHDDGLGGTITILAEGDHERPMIYRMCMPPGVSPPATEMHPAQREEFRVISGALSLGRIDGQEKILHAGETYTLDAGRFHLPACHGTEPVVFEATLTPGLDSAKMFEGVYAAFRGHKGLGRLVQLAGVFTTHAREIRFPGPFATFLRALAVFAR